MINDKKVALMTWFTYHNYGTALQASALVNVVNKLGYNIDVINYQPKIETTDRIYKSKADYFKKTTKRVFEKLFNLDIYNSEQKENLFSDYLSKRIALTKKCDTYPELYALNEKYSAFICGSDQIWSPLCFDEKYFLSFVEDESKLISYAPSLGVSQMSDGVIKDKMSALIGRFSHLSVRESRGAEIIKNITGQNSKVVLDPTLLIDAKGWDEYTRKTEQFEMPKGKYILCYFLGGDKYKKAVLKLSKKLRLPLYYIPVTIKQKKSKYSIKQDVGPSEFVELIKNAAYVCTDSFHGTAFSINYNIPFTVYERFGESDERNQNSRIYNILSLLKLENRLYTKDGYIEKNCDFADANNILKKQREFSINYLKNALLIATNSVNNKENGYYPTKMCCGCGSCASICPENAIEIKKDEDGFEKYFIDRNKCVNCGLCGKVCAFNNIEAQEIENAKTLVAMKAKNVNILKKSSSGGIGYLLSKYAIKNDMIVAGCSYDSTTNSASHIFVDKEEDLSLLQGSKYIQSVSAQTIKELIRKVKNNNVMFFGTPCQVAGVDKLMRQINCREKVVLVDLICHGVPSDLLWQKYLKEIDEIHKVGVNPKVMFRDKKAGWRKLAISIIGSGIKYSKTETKDDFYPLFRYGLCYMKACSECPYREKTAADIRLGDFWGNRFVKDKTGVSMVIINTEKGEQIIDGIKGELSLFEEYELNEYYKTQQTNNVHYPLFREELLDEIKSDKPLRSIRRKYCAVYDVSDKVGRLRFKIKRILRK